MISAMELRRQTVIQTDDLVGSGKFRKKFFNNFEYIHIDCNAFNEFYTHT